MDNVLVKQKKNFLKKIDLTFQKQMWKIHNRLLIWKETRQMAFSKKILEI